MTGQTVRGAVAEKEAQKSAAYGDLRAARDWFATAVPSHIDPDQYLAVLLGLLTRNDKLREAAEANPTSMMVAAAECARLGLVPGDTYHFVPFKNRKVDRNQWPDGKPEVTGIIDYRGEIDLIYRAGGVESVHASVVRANDEFRWEPGMRLPHHKIAPNDHGQVGLSDEKERGILTGAYAYARLRGGGISQLVVMGAREIAKHRDLAKTFEMWGPEWPDEGPWTPNMWRKTVLHGLPTWVPTSPEYVGELWRAAVAVNASNAPAVATPERPAIMPPTPSSGGGTTVRAAVESARSSASAVARTKQAESARARGYRTMHAVFRDASIGGEANHEAQLAVLRVLMRPHPDAEPGGDNLASVGSMASLTDDELAGVSAKLMQMAKGTKNDELKAGMLALVRAGGFEGELHG